LKFLLIGVRQCVPRRLCRSGGEARGWDVRRLHLFTRVKAGEAVLPKQPFQQKAKRVDAGLAWPAGNPQCEDGAGGRGCGDVEHLVVLDSAGLFRATKLLAGMPVA